MKNCQVHTVYVKKQVAVRPVVITVKKCLISTNDRKGIEEREF